ncbi:unnamed protein product [Arctogadus glacialis]
MEKRRQPQTPSWALAVVDNDLQSSAGDPDAQGLRISGAYQSACRQNGRPPDESPGETLAPPQESSLSPGTLPVRSVALV